MSAFSKIDVEDKDVVASLQGFFKSLLASEKIDALLVPWQLPMKNAIMPTLIRDPEAMDRADPLAPSFALNAAKIASRLTKKEAGKTVGLVMRSCEIRAFIELIKLNQGALDNCVIIGIDCLGAYSNRDYADVAKESGNGSTRRFYEAILAGQFPTEDGPGLAPACKICEHPIPVGGDIIIGLYGVDYTSHLLVEAATPKGEEIIEGLGLTKTEASSHRKDTLDALISERITKRDKRLQEVALTTANINDLSGYLAGCVNCYNCRVACPVCYCRECVFVTDVFDHDPYQYMQWAKRKGKIKMPTDTGFFHLTRMAHISLSCVGCGQCSNACPNDIPLMELFRNIALHTQNAFDYEAGRSVDEPIPLSVFEDKEYEDVVGITSRTEK